MNVLIACEESQTSCKAFRSIGHNAYSCDIQYCSGGHPEWHIMQDVLPLLNGNCSFTTCDGTNHTLETKWDLIIAHPPCTFLTVSGNRWFNVERYGEKAIQREKDREEAIAFFMRFVTADCDKIAIENPVGTISMRYRIPDQIVQPWQFGDNYCKQTCLWLNGLPKLKADITEKPTIEYREWIDKRTGKKKRQAAWYFDAWANGISKEDRARIRSKTPEGIAKAMASQWGNSQSEPIQEQMTMEL